MLKHRSFLILSMNIIYRKGRVDMGSHSIKLNKERSLAIGLVIGTMLSCIITLLSTILVSQFISNEKLHENNFGLYVALIHYLSTLAGTFFVNLITKKKIIPVSLLLCVCYLAVLFACTALVFDGQYSGVGGTLIAVTLGCASGIIIQIGVGKIKNKPFAKRSYG